LPKKLTGSTPPSPAQMPSCASWPAAEWLRRVLAYDLRLQRRVVIKMLSPIAG